MYCLKCQAHTQSKNPKLVSVGGRSVKKATCAQCGGAKRQFASKQKGAGLALDAVNLYRKTACGGRARPLLPGEKHPGCYNFAGPGTVLNAQTLAYPPYDAVDAVAKTHDIAYDAAFKMTDPQAKKDAIRAADVAMINELKSKGLQNSLAAKAIGVKMNLENSGGVGRTLVKTFVGKDYTGKGRKTKAKTKARKK
jgi:hypothetical protein